MFKNMKKYSGQAIAIIMIVLVVATVVGASLYSRMVTNTGEIVDTRESQRALEQADSILDVFISSDLPTLQGILSNLLIANAGEKKFTSVMDTNPDVGLKGFLGTQIDTTILDNVRSVTGWCEPPEKGSSIEITISYADQNHVVEYNVGDVVAINTANVNMATLDDACRIRLDLTARGNGDSLFSTKYVYMDSNGVVPYKLDDMELRCVKNTGDVAQCGSGIVAPTDSIVERIASGGSITINPKLSNLYEFRLLPLKEKLGVAVIPQSCGNVFNNYAIRAKVTCKGDTREKQVVIPSVNNMGYSALFDYTIYNANGTLNPN